MNTPYKYKLRLEQNYVTIEMISACIISCDVREKRLQESRHNSYPFGPSRFVSNTYFSLIQKEKRYKNYKNILYHCLEEYGQELQHVELDGIVSLPFIEQVIKLIEDDCKVFKEG